MKPFLIALALASFTAVAHAQTTGNEVINQQTPFSGIAVNPCNGEPLVYFGSCHSVTHLHTRADGASVDNHMNCHATGQGALGNNYTVNLNSMQRLDTPGGCATSQRFREVTRFITSRVTQNFVMTVTFLVTVDENCQPHVEVDQTETECRGRGGVF
jgi:hypothetical protein